MAMYTTHFLQGERVLENTVRDVVEHSVIQAHKEVGEDLDLGECEVFVMTNAEKIPEGGMFLGLSYDQAGIYLFVNAPLVEQKVTQNTASVKKNLLEHLYRSLYATARAKHMNLNADCGLLEEVINEGLSELFVIEKTLSVPQNRYTQLSDEEIKQFLKRMGPDFDSTKPDIAKWFFGNEYENVPPFTAYSVGFAVADAYLKNTKRKSVDALTTPARDIAVLQNRY